MCVPKDKITLPMIIDQFKEYKNRPENGAWGSLHCVLDDQNVRDIDILGAVEWAREQKDWEAVRLAEILLQITRTQRLKIAKLL